MDSHDLLVLPRRFGRKVVPWPLTPLGESTVSALESAGYRLKEKSFWLDTFPDYPSYTLKRTYYLGSDNHYAAQMKTLIVPWGEDTDKNRDSGDFTAKDVTWYQKGRWSIPAENLLERLKDPTRGTEHFSVIEEFYWIENQLVCSPLEGEPHAEIRARLEDLSKLEAFASILNVSISELEVKTPSQSDPESSYAWFLREYPLPQGEHEWSRVRDSFFKNASRLYA